jgi:transposase InsO family protein
VAKPTIG